MHNLARWATRGKPPHTDQTRNQLLELRLSAGLSVAATVLRRYLASRPTPDLPLCVELCRAIAQDAIAQVPGHVAVEDVQAILEQREGRHVHK